ncbi:hypothetical protein [Methanoregula sp.]|uniref:hypothetical protein n=1 Tax=Methanoregula sp. TaxID=2052170 RepID=UPI003C76E9D0
MSWLLSITIQPITAVVPDVLFTGTPDNSPRRIVRITQLNHLFYLFIADHLLHVGTASAIRGAAPTISGMTKVTGFRTTGVSITNVAGTNIVLTPVNSHLLRAP